MRSNQRDSAHKTMRLLGLHPDQPLSLRQRMDKNALVEAMDYGATFNDAADAQRFVRRKRTEMVVIITLIVLGFGFVLAATAGSGFNDGYSAGMNVCELIIKRG